MTRFYLRYLLFTCVVAISRTDGLAVLNPAEPALLKEGVILGKGSCWSIKAGYLGYFEQNRLVQDQIGGVQNFSSTTNAALVAFNFASALDIYGYVGPYHYDYRRSQNSPISMLGAPLPVTIQTGSQTNTLWSVGAKAILWKNNFGDCGSTYFSIDAKYQVVPPNAFQNCTVKTNSGDNILISANGAALHIKEAQVALGIAQKFKSLTPYLGVKWAQCNGTFNQGASLILAGNIPMPLYDFVNSNYFGYYFGCSLYADKKFSVTAEADFANETAFTIASELRF